MYMPSGAEPATGQRSMLSQLQGTGRFKTFRANKELYRRIDAAPPAAEAPDANVYNALVEHLGPAASERAGPHASLPSSSGQETGSASVRASARGHDPSLKTSDL